MIVEAIRRFLAAHDLVQRPLVAAVSGGVDSTALLLALVELGDVKFTAAHVNHHLRGAESDDDEAYVRELCARYDIPLRVADGTLDLDAIRHRGIEATAREVRFARLKEIAGSSLIATAHQKNDQAETVLMRLMSGGGIAALRGIHPIRDDGVIRPLLEVTRAEIERFLAERNITPRFDRSNADPRFFRNRVRALLRDFDDDAIDNLAAIANQARQQWPVLESAIDAAEDVFLSNDETRFRSMPANAWLRQALLLRHIRRLDRDARDISAADLARLTGEFETLKRTSVTKSLELLRVGTEIVLRRRSGPEETPDFEVQLDAGSHAFIPEIQATVHIQRRSDSPVRQRNPATQQPGNQLIQLPLGALPHFTIRNRRDGDRFRPLGMSHDKKLKDFLIDRKIAASLRDRIPLVVWQGTIVWVAGVEVSELFKVTGEDAGLYEVAIEQDHENVQRTGD